MTKQDLVQYVQDRAAGGDITSDTLQKFKDATVWATFNTVLTEGLANGENLLGNTTFGVAYSALTGDYYITLSPRPLSGALGVKYVEDDCGHQYFGRRTIDQNVLMSSIRKLARPEFFVNDGRLTFTSQPAGTSYTVYMTPDFVEMEDDREFTCSNLNTVVDIVIQKIKATNNEPTEVLNNTKPDKG